MKPTRSTTDYARLAILGWAIVLIASIACGQRAYAQEIPSYRCSIEINHATIDTTLPSSIRSADEDWDEESPLEAVSIDLNGDGVMEKLVPNKQLAGTGGCPWVIYSVSRNTVIGRIDGAIIYVETKQTHGYAILECYWKMGAGRATIATYQFSGKKYRLSRKVTVVDDQIERYLAERKSVRSFNELRPDK